MGQRGEGEVFSFNDNNMKTGRRGRSSELLFLLFNFSKEVKQQSTRNYFFDENGVRTGKNRTLL